MIRRSVVRAIDALLAYAGYVCDECGVQIEASSAKVVTDDTGTFPVCVKCAAKYGKS